MLFVDGHCFACTDGAAAFARAICDDVELTVAPDCSAATLELIAMLFNEGSIGFAYED